MSAPPLPKQLSILLLEDDPLDAELTCASLDLPEGECSIHRVMSRGEFERALDERCFDVILADYSLPSFDGISALKISQQRCPDVPFIFVSGALGEELAIETLKQGATDYVLKHRLERLRPAVSRALREKEALLEKHRAEMRLRELAAENARLYEEARGANAAKDEFIAMFSHELRTPMTAILGWARLLKIGDLTGPDFEAAINAVERSATVQAQLIEDLLDVSRISTGKLTIDFQTIDLAEVLAAVCDAFRVQAAEKKIELVRRAVPEVFLVRGDRNRLQQVIGNLIQNAIKFTAEGGRVEASITASNDVAHIRIADDGIGIRPEFLPHLFEAFSQDEAGKRTKLGLGLGLSIVRHIAERHGGTVKAESEGEGRGATFTVTLPLLARAGSHRSSSAPVTEMPDLSGVNILFIEDDAETRIMIATLLRRCGAEVTDVDSVREGRRVLRDRTWNLIVSDIAMPEEDGFAMIAAVKEELGAAAPQVIALTAFGAPEARAKIAAAGFARHLMKPIDPFIFARTVAAMTAVQ